MNVLSGLIEKIQYPDERSFSDVPGKIFVGLFFMLLSQLFLHHESFKPDISRKPLNSPPPIELIELSGFSDNLAPAKFLMLWLQSFDSQPGISVSFTQLDYSRVIQWLDLIIKLDPRGQYPLLAASRIYAEVNDQNRQRQMLDFVYKSFLEDPNHRWPSLAQAIYVAKQRLNDLPLAYKYADAMATRVTVTNVPFWVKQMHIYVLEDMGELESARILIGGLLASGTIKDEHEIRFLEDRMKKLELQEKTGSKPN